MNTRDALEILVKNLKEMKKEVDENLVKGLGLPGAPKSPEATKKVDTIPTQKAVARNANKIQKQKPSFMKRPEPKALPSQEATVKVPAMGKASKIEKSGVVIIEGSKKDIKKDESMEMSMDMEKSGPPMGPGPEISPRPTTGHEKTRITPIPKKKMLKMVGYMKGNK